jgi:predicted DNA-binding transcriptional regulator YafY
MSRVVRLFDLIQALRRRRRAVTALALAEELGVSKRTVHRDIATLTALGAPIEGEAGVGYLLRSGFLVPPLMFSEAELEALALGGQWVRQRTDADLVEAAENALAKIAAVLPVGLVGNLVDPALISAPTACDVLDAVDPKLLRSAIRRGRKLRIRYASEGVPPSERTVWPVAVVYFDAVRILAAWCELRADFRHFRTDRITMAAELDERVPKSRRQLLQAWLARERASERRGPATTVARN